MHILEVQLESNDLAATRRFYTETLGMEVISESSGRLNIKAGYSILTFLSNQHANSFYHFAFTIPSQKFTEAHDWAGRRFTLLPVKDGSTIAEFTNWNARSFYCYDNNGNILEFIARYDLPLMDGGTFTASSILSISEMGIVTSNVEEYCRYLQHECGLDYFIRQPPQPGFAVLGDDEGLLIVVHKDRPWFPTLNKAGSFHTYVKLEDKGRQMVLSVPAGENEGE